MLKWQSLTNRVPKEEGYKTDTEELSNMNQSSNEVPKESHRRCSSRNHKAQYNKKGTTISCQKIAAKTTAQTNCIQYDKLKKQEKQR